MSRPVRNLVPRLAKRGWWGSALTDDGDPRFGTDDAEGIAISVQWLSIFVELSVGRVFRVRP